MSLDLDKNLLIEALRRINDSKGADVFLNQSVLISMLKDALIKAGKGNDELEYFRKTVEGTDVGRHINDGLKNPSDVQRVLTMLNTTLKEKPLFYNDSITQITLEIICEAFSWPVLNKNGRISATNNLIDPKPEFLERLDITKPLKVRFSKWRDSFFDILRKFTVLELTVDTISTLSKISDLINLKALKINRFEGEFDFVYLAKLIKLEKVAITAESEFIDSYEECHNIAALGTLSSLKELEIYHMNISDLVPISKLHNLEKLILKACGITSIKSLTSLTSLEEFDIEWNEVSDVSCLSNFPKLFMAECSNNNIRTSNSLPNKSPCLKELQLRNNYLYENALCSGTGDKTQVVFSSSNFPELKYLNLQGNPISNWDHCSDISEVGGRDFVVIGGKKYDTNITSLILDNGSLRNHNRKVLEHLPNLIELTINHDNIRDLSFVESLNKLKRLDLTDNKIEDLTQLNDLADSTLEYLNVSDNPIRVVGKVKKIAAVIGLPSNSAVFMRKLKRRLFSFEDVITLPNTIVVFGTIFVLITLAIAITTFFKIQPYNISNIASPVSTTNPIQWYNVLALYLCPIAGFILLLHFIGAIIDLITYLDAEEVGKTVILAILLAGAICGFIFGGLFPYQNIQYDKISVYGNLIDKQSFEYELTDTDIKNVENYIFENYNDIKEKFTPYVSNGDVWWSANSRLATVGHEPAKYIYQRFWITAWLAFIILAILLIFIVVYIVYHIATRKKNKKDLRFSFFALFIVFICLNYANYENSWHNAINFVSQNTLGKRIVNELAISNGEIYRISNFSNDYFSKPDGTEYKGEFLTRTITGNGEYKTADGIVYNGFFVVGKLYGQAKVYAPNGEIIYEGSFSGESPETAIFDKANGYLTSEEFEKCYNTISILADCKIPRAINFLGTMYEYGQYVDQDYEKAFQLYTEAAALGESRGDINLGLMYYNGVFVTKDESLGVELWKKAADQGNTAGAYYYAWANYHGYGTEQNIHEAVKYYKESSRDNPNAMYELGMIYAFDLGKYGNEEEGIKLLKQASEKGIQSATDFLASYEVSKTLVDGFNLSPAYAENDVKMNAYENVHIAMQTDKTENSISIDDALINFINTTEGSLDTPIGRTAEYLLLQSLTEYLYYEAPPEEQNLFMLLECLHAGKEEVYFESDLDRLINMRRDEEPEHIAVQHYDAYKSLVGTFAFNDVIDSCLLRFAAIDVIESSWYTESKKSEIMIRDEFDIPVLGQVLLMSFDPDTNQQNSIDMQALLQTVYYENVTKSSPILLSELSNFNNNENLTPTINNIIKFYSEFSAEEEETQ